MPIHQTDDYSLHQIKDKVVLERFKQSLNKSLLDARVHTSTHKDTLARAYIHTLKTHICMGIYTFSRTLNPLSALRVFTGVCIHNSI